MRNQEEISICIFIKRNGKNLTTISEKRNVENILRNSNDIFQVGESIIINDENYKILDFRFEKSIPNIEINGKLLDLYLTIFVE
jgi:hypothetical protein